MYYLKNNSNLKKLPSTMSIRLCRKTIDDLTSYVGDSIFTYRFRQLKIQNKNIYNTLFIVEPPYLHNTSKNFSDILENSRQVKRTQGVTSPIRVIKYPLNLLTTKF
jgi:hypothetical protein